jgi:hypothetical protein
MAQIANYRADTLLYSYKKVQITTADPIAGYIEGRDSADQPIQITFTFFHSPFVQVPKVGEYWLITRLDNNWVLHSRFETGNEANPAMDLKGGDVRIEAPGHLLINAGEVVMDFNKAAPSLAQIGTATIPGSAIYGSVSLDYINVGTAFIGSAFIGTATIGTASIGTSTTNTVYITNKLTRPIGTALPTSGVVDGQEEHLLADNSHGIIWSFRYRSSSASSYKWESVGASTHINFSTASYSLTSPGPTTWYGNGTPEQIYIPYTGEYLVCTGVQVLSSANNSPYRFGVTTSGTAGTPVIYFTGYCSSSSDSTTTSSNYFGTFTAGSYINQVYQSPSGHNLTISQRWFAVQPIRVTT